MFVDSQNFASLQGHNFVDNWFVALQCKTVHYLVKCSWDINSWVRETPEIHEHQTPTNNDDSTVHIKHIFTGIYM